MSMKVSPGVGIRNEKCVVGGVVIDGNRRIVYVQIAFIAGQTVKPRIGGIIHAECTEHTVEGAILQHENHDMVDLTQRGLLSRPPGGQAELGGAHGRRRSGIFEEVAALHCRTPRGRSAAIERAIGSPWSAPTARACRRM